jgi:hypothetical protein
MSPRRQAWILTALAGAAFLVLRSLPDTHCALLHAEHVPIVVDGVEFCGVNEEANFYRPRDLKFPYALRFAPSTGAAGGRDGRLTLADEDGRALLDHQLAVSHTRKLHLHLRSLARPGYVHLHPVPGDDGSWSFVVPPDFDLSQGAHAYVDFVPVRGGRVALAEAVLPSVPAALPGASADQSVQVAAFAASADAAGALAGPPAAAGRLAPEAASVDGVPRPCRLVLGRADGGEDGLRPPASFPGRRRIRR